MTFALLGPLLVLGLVLLAAPLLMVVGPALYAYRVTYAAQGREAALGAGVMTLVYAAVIVWLVHSPYGLIVGLVVTPGVIGWLMQGGRK